jgi:hypothetical protein
MPLKRKAAAAFSLEQWELIFSSQEVLQTVADDGRWAWLGWANAAPFRIWASVCNKRDPGASWQLLPVMKAVHVAN